MVTGGLFGCCELKTRSPGLNLNSIGLIELVITVNYYFSRDDAKSTKDCQGQRQLKGFQGFRIELETHHGWIRRTILSVPSIRDQ